MKKTQPIVKLQEHRPDQKVTESLQPSLNSDTFRQEQQLPGRENQQVSAPILNVTTTSVPMISSLLESSTATSNVTQQNVSPESKPVPTFHVPLSSVKTQFPKTIHWSDLKRDAGDGNQHGLPQSVYKNHSDAGDSKNNSNPVMAINATGNKVQSVKRIPCIFLIEDAALHTAFRENRNPSLETICQRINSNPTLTWSGRRVIKQTHYVTIEIDFMLDDDTSNMAALKKFVNMIRKNNICGAGLIKPEHISKVEIYCAGIPSTEDQIAILMATKLVLEIRKSRKSTTSRNLPEESLETIKQRLIEQANINSYDHFSADSDNLFKVVYQASKSKPLPFTVAPAAKGFRDLEHGEVVHVYEGSSCTTNNTGLPKLQM